MPPEEPRIYLNVPKRFSQIVARLGAAWDADARGWWIADHVPKEPFMQWLPRMHRPDRRAPYLVSQLVPEPLWGVNLRSLLPRSQWDALRRTVYAHAGHRCRVCGGTGPQWPVECNEQWAYESGGAGCGVQKLLRLVALCPDCHTVKHLGKANVDGRYEAAVLHLAHVNRWTIDEARQHAEAAFETWLKRSHMSWKLDLSLLRDWGILNLDLDDGLREALPGIEGVRVEWKKSGNLSDCAPVDTST